MSFMDSTPDRRFTAARKAAELAALFGWPSVDAMPANVAEFVTTRLVVLPDDDLKVLEALVTEITAEKRIRTPEPKPAGGGLVITRRPEVIDL